MNWKNGCIWAAAALLACGSFAAAQTQPADSARIDQLIKQLTSGDEQAAATARQELLSLGEPARAALEAHLKAKSTLENTLNAIETQRVAGPTLVSLDLKDATVEAVMAELSKQSGYEIRPYNDNSFQQANLPTITLGADKKPFWEVFREFCTMAELNYYNGGTNDRAIKLVPTNQGGQNFWKAPSVISGSFYIYALSIQRNNSVDFSGAAVVQRSVNLNLGILVEPKVKVMAYAYQPTLQSAVDDKGNSLMPANAGPARMRNSRSNLSYGNRGSMWNANVQLVYPEKNPGSKIALLKGSIQCVVQARSATVEFADLKAKDVTKEVGGRKVILRKVARGSDQRLNVSLFISSNGGGDDRGDSVSLSVASFKLLDEKNNEYTFQGMNNTSSTGEGIDATMAFVRRDNDGGVGEPVKLVVELPVSTQEIDIPFEFRDLTLP